MKPMGLAKEIYGRLMKLVEDDIIEVESYLKIAKEYVNLKYNSGEGYIDALWQLDGIEYSMYNSLNDQYAYQRLAEDCAMMVYRLNGGEGYNTYTLTDEIRNSGM